MGLFSRLHLDDGRTFQFKTGFDPWTDYDYKITDKIKWEPHNMWPGCHIDGVVEGWDEGGVTRILIAIKDCTIVGILEPRGEMLWRDSIAFMEQRYGIEPPPHDLWPEEAWEAKAQREAEREQKFREWCEKKGKDPDDPGSRIGYFTRIRMEEDGFYRRIMPQVATRKDELSVPLNFTEEEQKKVAEHKFISEQQDKVEGELESQKKEWKDYDEGEKLLMRFTVAPDPPGAPFSLEASHREMVESFQTWIAVTVVRREAYLVAFTTPGGTLFWRDVDTISPADVRRNV